ncbi:MAG: PilZ domain-containing protein [Magnetococcales bacterium]|nr:PilZ domain-containing protein [Magnetococcales bacterium]NGZ26580.1 PilZ domain-containing protein [Magnetococcales bacterium]
MSGPTKDSPAGKNSAGRLPEEPYDLIKDTTQVVRYIEKALADGENVEVTINDRTRIYFSYFLDHLPEAIPATPAAGADTPPTPASEGTQANYPPYQPYSYLREKNHLLIAPLSPAMGNALIRSSKEVDLRFFQGVKSLEFSVRFEGTLILREEPVLKLSFPREMRMIRKRRHYRAPCTEGANLQVFLKKIKENIPIRIVDMSVGGLGFCYNVQDPEEFPIGSLLNLELTCPLFEKLKISAFVRNVGRAGTKDGCEKNSGKVGVQFDIPNETIAMHIEETVAFMQREYLQSLQARRPAPRQQQLPQPEEEKTDLKGELAKLLNLKKKWGLP